MSWMPHSYEARAASGPRVFVTATIETRCPCPPRAAAAAILARTSATRSARPGKPIAVKFSVGTFDAHCNSAGICASRHPHDPFAVHHPRARAPLVFQRERPHERITVTFDSNLGWNRNLHIAEHGDCFDHRQAVTDFGTAKIELDVAKYC